MKNMKQTKLGCMVIDDANTVLKICFREEKLSECNITVKLPLTKVSSDLHNYEKQLQ